MEVFDLLKLQMSLNGDYTENIFLLIENHKSIVCRFEIRDFFVIVFGCGLHSLIFSRIAIFIQCFSWNHCLRSGSFLVRLIFCWLFTVILHQVFIFIPLFIYKPLFRFFLVTIWIIFYRNHLWPCIFLFDLHLLLTDDFGKMIRICKEIVERCQMMLSQLARSIAWCIQFKWSRRLLLFAF